MSSVAASPRARAAAPARLGGRPSTLTVYRWELRKLVSQKRTYLGLGLAVFLPLLFVVVEVIGHPHHHGDSVFARELTQSGLAAPVLMLIFLSAFFLPLIAALVSGDIVAAEDANGTLKTILTRSVERGQVFAAKALAAATYATVAVLLATIAATAAGVVAWGFHRIVTLSGTIVSAPKALGLIFLADLCYLIPLLSVACIGVMLSTVARNSAAAVIGTIAVPIVLYIVTAIPGLEAIHPYLLTGQFQAWQGLLRTPADWAPILHSAWVCALYALPALIVGGLVFLRRDVAGG
jgi:ABC-2 type transport system permease protein